jgi:hypothetical protein
MTLRDAFGFSSPTTLEREAPVRPTIQGTQFGRITVEEKDYERDIVIRPSGKVKKRKKKLSKKRGGNSHLVSLDEAKHIFRKRADRLIIGTGQQGNLRLSDEAQEYFKKKSCSVDLLPTPEAVEAWNRSEGKTIGMFHVTC